MATPHFNTNTPIGRWVGGLLICSLNNNLGTGGKNHNCVGQRIAALIIALRLGTVVRWVEDRAQSVVKETFFVATNSWSTQNSNPSNYNFS